MFHFSTQRAHVVRLPVISFDGGVSASQWRARLVRRTHLFCTTPGPAATSADLQSYIFGAALQEAHQSVSQVSVPYVPESVSRASLIDPALSPPPPPGSVAASLRRPAPQDSAQASSSKRHASFPGCPDHCPFSSRGWASFNAMKGHCARHLDGYLEGDLPLDWLHSVVYGVCGVYNRILSTRFRGRCPSC